MAAAQEPIAYDFLAPRRIVFGWGRRGEVGTLAAELGQRAFLVVGSQTLERDGVVEQLLASLAASSLAAVRLASIAREPEPTDVDQAVAGLRRERAAAGDLLVAIGGGSAIDLAKAAAALAPQEAQASTVEYLEGVGRGLKIVQEPLPVLAIPTTAGTGSEATKNAVISCYDPPFKKSLRDNRLLPRTVLVDPELTVSVPRETTIHTGLDAITQLIESYVTRRRNPLAQGLALAGLRLAAPAIERVAADGRDRPAREAMAHAALLSGMALANSGLGLAHGVAAALGCVRRTPHGLACAVMLPTAMRFNRAACQQEFAELAAALLPGSAWKNAAAAADAAVAEVERLTDALGVPRKLSALGVRREDLPALARHSRGNSLSGNPRDVCEQELSDLLEALL